MLVYFYRKFNRKPREAQNGCGVKEIDRTNSFNLKTTTVSNDDARRFINE